MLKQERKKFILKKLAQNHRVIVQDLSEELKVSDDTVRRDLNELSEFGLVEKVHGGALPKSPIPVNYDDRSDYSISEKKFIAKKAVGLIENGMTILLDGGTTNLELIRQLPTDINLLVFTNSLPIALELTKYSRIDCYLLGGKVNNKAKLTLGHDVIAGLKNLRADLCVLGVCSIDHQAGVTLRNKEECEVKQAFMESALKTIALSTSDKIGTAETFVLCKVEELSYLIVDSQFDNSNQADLLSNNVNIL